MALESTKDFDGYLDTNAHGVTGIFFEVQTALFDQRTGFIDTWFDIDTGAVSYTHLTLPTNREV